MLLLRGKAALRGEPASLSGRIVGAAASAWIARRRRPPARVPLPLTASRATSAASTAAAAAALAPAAASSPRAAARRAASRAAASTRGLLALDGTRRDRGEALPADLFDEGGPDREEGRADASARPRRRVGAKEERGPGLRRGGDASGGAREEREQEQGELHRLSRCWDSLPDSTLSQEQTFVSGSRLRHLFPCADAGVMRRSSFHVKSVTVTGKPESSSSSSWMTPMLRVESYHCGSHDRRLLSPSCFIDAVRRRSSGRGSARE
jgi:hypothetical protein